MTRPHLKGRRGPSAHLGFAGLWLVLLVGSACTPPPRPEGLGQFEALRIGPEAARIETRQPDLYAEAQAHYRAALTAYEDARDVESSAHFADLAALTWRAALARSQQQDHQDALSAARQRAAVAQEAHAVAQRRALAAEDAIGRQRRLLEMQARLVEVERKSRRQRKAAAAKEQLDAAALELQAAEALDAARHAPEPFQAAQAAMTQAIEALEGGNPPEAEEAAREAWRLARSAAGAARPLHAAEVAHRTLAARLAALVESAGALAGAEAHLEARGVVIRLRDLFATGQSSLDPGQASSLEALARLAAEHVDLRIVVEGHTDNRGSAVNNLSLSAARADAVAEALRGAGVAADRITAVGRGDEVPIADNGSQAGRARNRRVEVVFVRPH